MNSIICVDISVLISSLNASFQQLFRMLHKTSAKLQKNSELYKRKTQKPAKQRKSGLQKRAADNKSRGLLPQSGHYASSQRPCAVPTVPRACGPVPSLLCLKPAAPRRPYCASSLRLEVTSCRGRPGGWRRSCICGCARSSRWRRVPGLDPHRPRCAAAR